MCGVKKGLHCEGFPGVEGFRLDIQQKDGSGINKLSHFHRQGIDAGSDTMQRGSAKRPNLVSFPWNNSVLLNINMSNSQCPHPGN